MTNWIEVVDDLLPPTDMSVLLYVVELHENEESLWDEGIITGYYSEESNSWGCDYISEDKRICFEFKETNRFRVVAWTLLPMAFDYDKYKNNNKKFGFPLFRKIKD